MSRTTLMCGGKQARSVISEYIYIYIYKERAVVANTPIYTGSETDTHAHCIPGRVAGLNDLSYIVNSWKTHWKWQCYKLNWVCTPPNNCLSIMYN